MAQSDKTVGCFLAKRLYEPDVEYWRSSTDQEELLAKPPHEAVFIDGPEQVQAYFEQLRPVPDAYRRYLPDASRLDKLPSYSGYGLLVLPMPVVSAEEGLTEQVQAAVQAAGPVWLAGTDVPHCRTLFPAEDGYYVTLRTLALDLEHHRRGSRWRSCSQEYVEVRYAPHSARRSLHARRHLAKRDAVSVAELCQLIDALADEARSAGHLTGYRPTSWPRAGVQTLIYTLNTVLAVHGTICGRWAYRQNPQYVRFVQHARATQQATLRKFRDQGFRAWLQRELRSRSVKGAAARAGNNDVNYGRSRTSSYLPLPFDEAQTAEESRTGTANGRRLPRR
ncbi:MAG: hypothetical protein GX575_29610 [Candidatus Anammoximicrobium sp.]|nr:hypothetical protein [Candidatus Anammoximicrobium sp.]